VPTDLDARYGRSRGAAVRTRWIAIVAGVGVAVVVGAWLWWVGILSPAADIGVETLGYTVVDATETAVQFQVTVEQELAVDCAVQALDTDFATVGWKIIHLPASEQHTRQMTESVRTSHLAVSGLIYRCWPA
jgi:hypothetical protein